MKNLENAHAPQMSATTLVYNPDWHGIPEELQRIERWVAWQAKPKAGRPGKFDKVPIDPRTGRRVSHKDPCNHMSFDDAVMEYALQIGEVRIDGIGLSLPPGLCVIDLDNMILDDGAIRPEHEAILNQFRDCYCELSPSQRGAHIFVPGSARTFADHERGVELYSVAEDGSGGQFLTVTGMVYEDRGTFSTIDRTADLIALCEQYGARGVSSRSSLPPMPEIEGTPRTLQDLVAAGVITSAWAALIEFMAPDGDDDHLLRRYPATQGSRHPVQRSRALFAACRMLAGAGVPLWEAFAILTDRSYALVQGIDDGRSGDDWCWAYVFGKHLHAFESNPTSPAPFEDLGPQDWDNVDPGQNPRGAAAAQPWKRTFEPCVVRADNVLEFTGSIIPSRPWLVAPLLLRGYVTVCLAPPGVGKSITSMGLVASLITGLDLIGLGAPAKPCKVLVINNEDDHDEMARRFQGILIAHGIDPANLPGELHWISGYEGSYKLSKSADKVPVKAPDADMIVDYCLKHQIDAVFFDPLVSLHEAEENDNGAIEKVAAIVRQVAARTGGAVHLVAHTRKAGSGESKDSEAHAGSLDALRGASSMGGAIRVAYTVARMSKKTAEKLEIAPALGVNLMRVDLAKGNFTPKPENALGWLALREQTLPNGKDKVGVPTRFDIKPYVDAAGADAEAKAQLEDSRKAGQILAALGGERERKLVEILPALAALWDSKETAVRDQLKHLVPVGRENARRVEPGTLAPAALLWMERRGQPFYICQEAGNDWEE